MLSQAFLVLGGDPLTFSCVGVLYCFYPSGAERVWFAALANRSLVSLLSEGQASHVSFGRWDLAMVRAPCNGIIQGL